VSDDQVIVRWAFREELFVQRARVDSAMFIVEIALID
jgi:hypothetical protein